MERGECEKCRELEVIIVKQQAQIDELEKRLLRYENSNTPPSQQRKYPRREKSGKRIGAPQGHPGTTREIPEPNRFKELKLENYPDCGKRLGRPRSIHKRESSRIFQIHNHSK